MTELAVPFAAPHTMASRRAVELRDVVQRVTVAHEVQARRGEPDGLVATAAFGTVHLVYVRYGAPVLVDALPTQHRFVMSVPLGPMRVAHPGTNRADTLRSGFVLAQDERTIMDPDPIKGALVFSTSMARIEEQLTGLTGRPPARALRFLPPHSAPTAAPAELLESSWQLVCRTLTGLAGRIPSPVIAGKLEDVLLSAVLLALPHTATADLLAEDPAPPRELPDRARRWLEDHHAEPVTVTDLARAVGISVRRLQHVFAARFDVTPTEMLRDIRLTQARQSLSDPAESGYPTVAAVAHRCGFTHLGRFAIAYRERFGESPSDTLRRAHGRG